jgi:hypothetical protein
MVFDGMSFHVALMSGYPAISRKLMGNVRVYTSAVVPADNLTLKHQVLIYN